MILTIIIFILILGLLVLVHELGHFTAAKRSGVRVDEFGLGFPPKLFSVKKGETEYSLNALPIGGFVKIFGEDALEEELEGGEKELGKEEMERNFALKSIGTRAKITVAGVVMNFLLAFVLFSFGFMIGLPAISGEIDKDGRVESQGIFWGMIEEFDDTLNKTATFSDEKIQIIAVSTDSPAEEAGIKMGDTIASLGIRNPTSELAGRQESGIRNNEKILEENLTVKGIQTFIKENAGKEIIIGILRGKEAIEITVVPRVNPPEGEGAMGIALDKTAMVSYPFYIAPIKGLETTVVLTFTFLGGYYQIIKDLLFTGKAAVQVMGPVGIAGLTGQMMQLGFVYLIQFAAILSLNLAIINIFPFPALDGGRLAFMAIEKIKGSPVSLKWERMAHTIGFALLMLLILVITFKDIARFF